jgi:hypothetical protein
MIITIVGCINLKNYIISSAENNFFSMITMFLEKFQKTRKKSAFGLSV